MGYDEFNEVMEQYQAWLNQGAIEIESLGKNYYAFGYTELEPGNLDCTCGQELRVVEMAQGAMAAGDFGTSVVVKRFACPNCHKQYALKLESVGGVP